MPDNLFLLIIIFVASLALLVYSADKFVENAEKIGLALGIPSFVIGVTVVALGTSLPELVSSIIAVLQGEPGIVIGNVVGSNITNILLILGVVGLVAISFTIHFNFKKIDLPYFIISTLFLYLSTRDQNFTIIEAWIGLVILLSYIIITMMTGREEKSSEVPFKSQYLLIIILAGFGIYFGARYNVESVVKIGELLKISPTIIALTAVALGTSLPELFVSLAAIRKDNAEIAVGNILGSNIFNALLIMGIPRLIGPLDIPDTIVSFSMPVLLVASLLFVLFTWNKKVNWIEGAIFLLGYLLFIYFSFV